MSRFLIEAMVQVTKGFPYTKVAFISGNGDINYHKKTMQQVYHEILSVKSVPADDELLLEYGDTQGNMPVVNTSDVIPEPTEDVSDTFGESGPST